MSDEKKPTVWKLWTDRSKRTPWQQGYVEAFPMGLISGLQLGMALMLFIQWVVK